MQIVKIKGCIKNYWWGSRDVLPSLFHYKADGQPQAEAWFGVHPDGQAELEDGSLLKDYLDKSPELLAGLSRGEPFPLMLKVLAVNNPLSLHVHPDKVQAQRGWREEELKRRKGLTSELNYKDENCKSELFCALTPSTLLVGFRDAESAAFHLKRLCPESFTKYFSSSRTIRGIFKTLFTLPQSELDLLIDEYLRGLDESGEELTKGGVYYTERGISVRIHDLFGNDPSVVVPYLMNVISMRIGETVYIKSGMLHSYIHATGIEIEDSSDNEVRIGMSSKHKDVMDALNLIDYDFSFTGKIPLVPDQFLRQIAQGSGWALAVLPSGSYDIRESLPSIAICTEGQARVGTSSDHIMLKEGECCFIPSCDEEYHIRVSGKVFQALCGTGKWKKHV